jgi:predicted transcriptional regulator
MARPRSEPKVNVTIGVEIGVVNRVDALAERLRTSRSAILRNAADLGLPILERKNQPKAGESAATMPFPPTPL